MGSDALPGPAPAERPFVGRGGLKLHHALEQFQIDVHARICADLGANVGGFTDCLLRAGAGRVYAVDTAYGVLDYRLRTDTRVTVMERTNALHADPPPDADKPSLIVMDLGWTPQRLAVPAALLWLANAQDARIISLIKPQYEADRTDARRAPGILEDAEAERIAHTTAERMPEWGAHALSLVRSPIRGGATRGVKQGNLEWLALLSRAAT
ncbi:MAG: SAM-dependent methyltransferase [Phycisphaerales bacterium]